MSASLHEFMDFKLFGKAILVKEEFRLVWGHLRK